MLQCSRGSWFKTLLQRYIGGFQSDCYGTLIHFCGTLLITSLLKSIGFSIFYLKTPNGTSWFVCFLNKIGIHFPSNLCGIMHRHCQNNSKTNWCSPLSSSNYLDTTMCFWTEHGGIKKPLQLDAANHGNVMRLFDVLKERRQALGSVMPWRSWPMVGAMPNCTIPRGAPRSSLPQGQCLPEF